MKTLSKQTNDTQFDADVSSFQTSNNLCNKNNIYKANVSTYTNNNSNKRYFNYKKRIKNNSFKKFTLFNNYSNNNNSKNKNNLYLFSNNTLNNENHSFSTYKKRIRAKTKGDTTKNKNINVKPASSTKNKSDYNSLNISNNSKSINKNRKNNILNNEPNNLLLKKSNTSKILKINIKKCCKNQKFVAKLGNPNLNIYTNKTNINSPLGSDRDEKQIISLNHELTNKNVEIKDLKKRIDEQNNYITELEDKIKNIIDAKVKEDIEYEQYSKKMIVRNIKVLTTENEELHKQINEYKDKEIKIMKVLYYLNKQGISIDSFLEKLNNEK
jgi:hypothetical protein